MLPLCVWLGQVSGDLSRLGVALDDVSLRLLVLLLLAHARRLPLLVALLLSLARLLAVALVLDHLLLDVLALPTLASRLLVLLVLLSLVLCDDLLPLGRAASLGGVALVTRRSGVLVVVVRARGHHGQRRQSPANERRRKERRATSFRERPTPARVDAMSTREEERFAGLDGVSQLLQCIERVSKGPRLPSRAVVAKLVLAPAALPPSIRCARTLSARGRAGAARMAAQLSLNSDEDSTTAKLVEHRVDGSSHHTITCDLSLNLMDPDLDEILALVKVPLVGQWELEIAREKEEIRISVRHDHLPVGVWGPRVRIAYTFSYTLGGQQMLLKRSTWSWNPRPSASSKMDGMSISRFGSRVSAQDARRCRSYVWRHVRAEFTPRLPARVHHRVSRSRTYPRSRELDQAFAR